LAEFITWYDILGVTAGAASDTISYAYAQRTAQLRPELLSGASSPVMAAATRAREAVQAAWLVLGDPGRRNRYDKAIGLHRKRGRGFAHRPYEYGRDPYDALRAADSLIDGDAWYAFGALASWMAPLPAPPRRRLIVPDVRGLFYRSCQAVVTMAGLRLDFVRLTPDPSPVEGLIVGQSPEPGAQVRHQSTLTVHVWHPPRQRWPAALSPHRLGGLAEDELGFDDDLAVLVGVVVGGLTLAGRNIRRTLLMRCRASGQPPFYRR
jgi:hypothetical protein